MLKDSGTSMRFDPAARWVHADPIQIQQVLNNLFRKIRAEPRKTGAVFRFTLPAATTPRREIEAEAA